MSACTRINAGLRRLARGLVLALVVVPWAGAGAAEERVFLTEFMAANTRTLMDRDRDYPDWMEVFNAGVDPVNLEGWFLTDDRENLRQWRFPSVTLGPGEYLIVFASGKDRRLPGGELHTNFKLEASGEYLALIKPDGRTAATEFAPKFPPQMANGSYGLVMGDQSAVLVGASAPKRVFVPTQDPGVNWLNLEFDDSSWLAGTNGVGFADGAVYAGAIGCDVGAAMRGRSAAACIRVPCVLPETGFEKLKLRLRYDDGFVAYVNGWEVARKNAPSPAAWNSTATAAHGPMTPGVLEENFEGSAGRYATAQSLPATRPKVSARNSGSSGQFLRLINGQSTNQVNSITFAPLSESPADRVTVNFDFRFKGSGEGTDRLTLALVPSAVYGVTGDGIELNQFKDMKEPNLPGVLSLVLRQEPASQRSGLTLYWGRNARFTASLPNGVFNRRVFHRARLEVVHDGDGARVTVLLTADVNGRAQQFTPVQNHFLAGLRPFAHRLQFAGRIGHWDQTIDLDTVRLETTGTGGAVEEFDLTSHLDVFKTGTNLLAILALNRAADDPTLLALPELVAGFGAVQTSVPRYFAAPTARAANGEGYTTVAPAPVFSVRGGVFSNTVTVELKSETGEVRVTRDGSEPTQNSELYATPIRLTGGTLLRARTFTPDEMPSEIVGEHYTILENDMAGFTSNLPLLIVQPMERGVSSYRYGGSGGRMPVGLRCIDVEAQSGRSRVGGPADYAGRAIINTRGFSTARQAKHSYTVRLRDDRNDKVKAGVFGLPKESDWVLYAPYSDKTLLRDVLAYELSNEMGRYAPRTRFVEVFFERAGARLSMRDYGGVYVFEERISPGKNRVNVQKLTPADATDPAVTGGYIVKRDHSNRYEPGFYTSRGLQWCFVEPDAEEITREQKLYLQRFMNDFERALYGPNFAHPGQGYAAYLDVDAFIDQHWLIEYSKNIDGFRYSAFAHKDRGGKLAVGPAWDWNLSFGNADYHEGWKPNDWYTDLLRDTEICWFRRLREDPEFMQRTIDRWGTLRRSTLSSVRVLGRIDAMAAQLQEAQARNFNRWPVLGRSINPNYFVGESYAEEINWMKQWVTKRGAWIDSQFLAPPTLSLPEGAVAPGATLTMKSGSGKVYYTTDGSDPRLPGGETSPKAQAYSSAVAIKGPLRLTARAHRGREWSAPVTAQYSARGN